MLVKDFKRFAIHDLFKVSSFSLSLFYFLRNLRKMSNSPLSIYFFGHVEVYAVSTQAKELCNKAKTTNEKSKKLTNEVILKKGEVIRLTNEAFSSTRN